MDKKQDTSPATEPASAPALTNLKPINPFLTVINGLSLIFSSALGVAMVILIVNALISFNGIQREFSQSETNETIADWIQNSQQLFFIVVIFIVIAIFALAVGTMIHGLASYATWQLSRGEKVSLKDAFYGVLEKFGSYLILYLWMNLKIFLWTLLFIIPGIFAYYRYIFAGIIFFDKNLPHEKAIKESIRLTKGGRMTIFGSHILFSIITLGYIDQVILFATNSQLYPLYKKLDESNTPKPDIHWLSWVSLILPFVIFLLLILFIFGIAVLVGLSGPR